eukprot:6947356-Prymnesium_polylepis.1
MQSERDEMKPSQENRYAEIFYAKLDVGDVGSRRVGKADVCPQLDLLRDGPAHRLQDLATHRHRVGLRVDNLLERHHGTAAALAVHCAAEHAGSGPGVAMDDCRIALVILHPIQYRASAFGLRTSSGPSLGYCALRPSNMTSLAQKR